MLKSGSFCCGVAFAATGDAALSTFSTFSTVVSGGGDTAVSAFFVTSAAGFTGWGDSLGLNQVWVTNITTPISRNASSSRISIDISFFGALPLSAIQKFRRKPVTGRGQSRRAVTDGSAPNGECPSTPRAAHHGAPPLPACKSNTSDGSGTPKATAGKSNTYIREDCRL